MSHAPSTIDVATDAARTLGERILLAIGVADDDATRVVDSLLFADRRGVGTHGLMRLPFYVDRVRAGGIDPRASTTVVRDSPATALLDGGNGFGAVVTTRVAQLAIEKAASVGAATVVGRAMNHFGAAAYYATMASARGMVGIVMGNVTASMSPTGGTTAVVGNNPIAFAIPSAGPDPVVFDATTSRSSWGALLRAMQRGEPVAEGAFLGPDGKPSVDPAVILAGGSLQPIESYKGYGLALVIGLLTGVLGGGSFDADIKHPYRELAAAGDNAALAIALDVQRFVALEEFAQRVDMISREIRSAPRAEGTTTIMVPGDREAQTARAYEDHVALDVETLAQIEKLAAELGVGTLDPSRSL
jgi:L-2-hydroxycarboxylate dehydrogenase (NAD+)